MSPTFYRVIRGTLVFFRDIALPVIVCAVIARAESGGSAYSRFGLGDIRYFPDERAAGMGGVSVAVLSTNTVNILNPAGWTRLNRVRFSLSALYEGFAARDAQGSTFLSGAVFNGFVLAVPILPENGLSLSTGIVPYTALNYRVLNHVPDPTFPYTLKYSGDGGITQAYLGLSISSGKDWHFGVKLNYFFGTLQSKTMQSFGSSQYTDVELTRKDGMSGIGGTFGVNYTGFGEILGMSESQNFTLGAFFSTGGRLRTSSEKMFVYTQGSTVIGRDTTIDQDATTLLPFSFGFGGSYNLKDQLLIAGDVFYQKWGDLRMSGVHPSEIRDSYRISLGAEIAPLQDARASFLSRTAYRFGAYYMSDRIRLNGQGINAVGFTGGVTLPVFEETRFTIGVDYSIRGTAANQLVKENILRVSFTLSGAERWFVRSTEE